MNEASFLYSLSVDGFRKVTTYSNIKILKNVETLQTLCMVYDVQVLVKAPV
jgi:hypothetical protein